MKKFLKITLSTGLFLLSLMMLRPAVAQDTLAVAAADSSQIVPADTLAKKEKVDRKRKDAFILYVGGSVSDLSANTPQYNATGDLGYHLGASYRRGKFLYWGAGAKFNAASYGLQASGTANDSTALNVKSFDIPLTVGIDFLFFTSRVFTIRAFGSAVPSFLLAVTDDTGLNLEKDDLNSFILYGQGGIGFDIAFLVIEVGYNYGFQDLLKAQESKPGQAFVNLGFRF